MEKRKVPTTNHKITPSEFYRLTGINPLPVSKAEAELLSKYDISIIDYRYQDLTNKIFDNTNIIFNPLEIKNNSIQNSSFENVDLSNISFKYTIIKGSNLKNTNIKLEPNSIWGPYLCDVNLEGNDLSKFSCDNFNIIGTNLKDTKALINLQRIVDKDASYANIMGCQVTGYNESVIIDGTIVDKELFEEIVISSLELEIPFKKLVRVL